MRNLYEHISALAHADPLRPMLLECGATGKVLGETTREALLVKIEEAASYLVSRGLQRGDRVALDFDTSADFLIISWAAWSMGIVTVPLDTRRDTPELRAFKIDASRTKSVLPREEWTVQKREVRWMPGISHEALILFTSGTTARPKGAELTLGNLVVNAESIIEWLHIRENDRFLVELPLYHINSTTFCLAALVAGASIAIPPRYSNSHFFEHAAMSGATFTSVVPSIIFDQLNRKDAFTAARDRLKLTRIQIGSAPVIASAVAEFIHAYTIPLYQGYGQTETALRVTGVPTDLPRDMYETLITENSIGTPLSWAHVEIADMEGRILREGQEGELVVKGPAVMRGYIGGESAFRDGYFLTGDIGYWKNVGGRRFFFLKGRIKELIIKGGVNISPVAVENALKKIDHDIEQVYVVGVRDERFGEEVGAAIVWREGVSAESALRKLKLLLLCGSEALSAYETPRYVRVIQRGELPTTSTGKVQRSVLKENLAGTFEQLENLLASTDFQFKIISAQSPLFRASHELYNHCWQPLTQSEVEYKKYLGEYTTLGAVDTDGALAGQISFSCRDKKLTCVSICSATFKPKPVPEVAQTPSVETVREYLRAGHDPVMNFHTKLGAELVEVVPNGRPEDKSSLGYTMLLRYPPVERVDVGGTVSSQLIQVIRLLGADMGAEVFAISRPGGLATYLAER